MKKTFALLLILSLLLSCTACGKKETPKDTAQPTQQDETEYPSHLALSLGTAPVSFVCAQVEDHDASYLVHLFEGLYRYDAQGSCVNAIAQTEKVDETGLVWTFTLREDALWSDGTPVRAQDFVYAWQHAVDPGTQSAYAALFLPIQNASSIIEGNAEPSTLGVEAVSDYELKVTFTRKIFRVSSLFVHHAFYPLREDLVASYDPTAEGFDGTKLVVNGAYTITQYTADGMTLIRRDDYYAKDAVLQDSIQFLFMEQDAQYESFIQHKLYYATDITNDLRLATFGIDQSPIVTANAYGVTCIVLHHDTAPLDNADVRNALLLTVRQQVYSDAAFGAQLPATGLIPASFSTPGTAANFREGSTPLLVTDSVYAQNIVLAKNLLNDAGYEDVTALNELEFIYNADEPMQKSLAELLAQGWKDALGFAPRLVPLDAETFHTRLMSGKYAMALAVYESETDDPSNILSSFITGIHENVGNYASVAFDELMLQAQNADNITQRYDFYQQAEAQLLSDAAVIPLLFDTTQGLQSEKLQNVITTANGYVIFSYCTIK